MDKHTTIKYSYEDLFKVYHDALDKGAQDDDVIRVDGHAIVVAYMKYMLECVKIRIESEGLGVRDQIIVLKEVA